MLVAPVLTFNITEQKNMVSEIQSKLAIESRAYPLMVFDPRKGEVWENNISIQVIDIDLQMTKYK